MTAWEASKELHLFPVKVREYRKPDDECNAELIKFFKTYPQKQSNFPEGVITSKPDLYKCDNVWVKRIHEWFNCCLEEYWNQYQLHCDHLQISQSWFNCAPAGDGFGHPLHRHPMSYVSAVYYLTEGSPTAFDDPCTPRVYDTLDIHMHKEMEAEWGINETIEAEPNKLIIFPAWLRHFSGSHFADYDRWSMSFNAFPTGKINIGPWDYPQLEVKVL